MARRPIRLVAGVVIALSLALMSLAALGSVYGWDWDEARCGTLPNEYYPELGWIAFVGVPAIVGLIGGGLGLWLGSLKRSAGRWHPEAILILGSLFCLIAAYWAVRMGSGCPAIS